MTEKIEAAMTPDEWGTWQKHPPSPQEWDYATGELGGVSTHGLAALALYGLPEGFTWEDVDLLRRDVEPVAADRAVGTGEQAAVQRLYDRLESLASRIAALLPPRTP